MIIVVHFVYRTMILMLYAVMLEEITVGVVKMPSGMEKVMNKIVNQSEKHEKETSGNRVYEAEVIFINLKVK